MERRKFLKAEKRVLFLPHCSRKFMDNRCKAFFDANLPSYTCVHCSKDCLVNKADRLAKKKEYNVYILPESSCIPKILETNQYEEVVGVACGEETKMSVESLDTMMIARQAIPDKEWVRKHSFQY